MKSGISEGTFSHRTSPFLDPKANPRGGYAAGRSGTRPGRIRRPPSASSPRPSSPCQSPCQLRPNPSPALQPATDEERKTELSKVHEYFGLHTDRSDNPGSVLPPTASPNHQPSMQQQGSEAQQAVHQLDCKVEVHMRRILFREARAALQHLRSQQPQSQDSSTPGAVAGSKSMPGTAQFCPTLPRTAGGTESVTKSDDDGVAAMESKLNPAGLSLQQALRAVLKATHQIIFRKRLVWIAVQWLVQEQQAPQSVEDSISPSVSTGDSMSEEAILPALRDLKRTLQGLGCDYLTVAEAYTNIQNMCTKYGRIIDTCSSQCFSMSKQSGQFHLSPFFQQSVSMSKQSKQPSQGLGTNQVQKRILDQHDEEATRGGFQANAAPSAVYSGGSCELPQNHLDTANVVPSAVDFGGGSCEPPQSHLCEASLVHSAVDLGGGSYELPQSHLREANIVPSAVDLGGGSCEFRQSHLHEANVVPSAVDVGSGACKLPENHLLEADVVPSAVALDSCWTILRDNLRKAVLLTDDSTEWIDSSTENFSSLVKELYMITRIKSEPSDKCHALLFDCADNDTVGNDGNQVDDAVGETRCPTLTGDDSPAKSAWSRGQDDSPAESVESKGQVLWHEPCIQEPWIQEQSLDTLVESDHGGDVAPRLAHSPPTDDGGNMVTSQRMGSKPKERMGSKPNQRMGSKTKTFNVDDALGGLGEANRNTGQTYVLTATRRRTSQIKAAAPDTAAVLRTLTHASEDTWQSTRRRSSGMEPVPEASTRRRSSGLDLVDPTSLGGVGLQSDRQTWATEELSHDELASMASGDNSLWRSTILQGDKIHTHISLDALCDPNIGLIAHSKFMNLVSRRDDSTVPKRTRSKLRLVTPPELTREKPALRRVSASQDAALGRLLPPVLWQPCTRHQLQPSDDTPHMATAAYTPRPATASGSASVSASVRLNGKSMNMGQQQQRQHHLQSPPPMPSKYTIERLATFNNGDTV